MRLSASLRRMGCTLLAALIFAPVSVARPAEPSSIEVTARTIGQFRIGREETRFGALEFVGGLELVGAHPFGGMSAFRFRRPGSDFMGVTDNGQWFFGRVERDGQGRPAGWSEFRMAPMRDAGGGISTDKVKIDAEGLAIAGERAIVSYEREHKVLEFRIDPDGMGPPLRSLDFLVPAHELRRNRGFETVIATPPDGPHGGAIIVIVEKSIDKAGNVFGAVLGGPRKGIFTVARTDDYDITDGAMLPGGDLLLLERRFTLTAGIAMRLRRISADTVGRGMIADGPVLLEADMAYQIDNMEGLDVWRRDDGATMVSIVSDDNQSFLQRNLYLEFRLGEW